MSTQDTGSGAHSWNHIRDYPRRGPPILHVP